MRYNMSDETAAVEEAHPGKLFLPSLIISCFAVNISVPMLALLTVDMAITFFGNAQPATLGAMAQLSTLNAAAMVVFALLMGVLAVRFKHKPLLLVGVLLVVVSAVGGFLAPTFSWMQLSFIMEGIGTIMVSIMIFTMIGEFLPLQKKAKAVSYIVAVTTLAILVGTPVIGFITNVGGWRLNFLWFVLPVSAAGLVLAFLTLPSKSHEKPLAAAKGAYLSSFKQVLLNKSAAACLVGVILSAASGVGLFAIAFYRQQFLMSRDFTVGQVLVATSMYVVASLVVGRLVNRVGAKTLIVAGSLGGGILLMLFFFMPNLWIALTLDMIHVWFAAAAFTAFQCLILDQVPKSRGTMISMTSMFANIGGAIGAAVGGAMLILFSSNQAFSYQAVGLALGAMSIAGAAVIYFFTKDPNRP
jgi:DHA1 family inner membrane transport protein